MKVTFDRSTQQPQGQDSPYEGKLNLVLHPSEKVIALTDVLTFPGLVNSHDHLDFNLFPTLSDRVYSNYKEWGADIHQRFNKEISEVLKIPVDLRIKWGVIKNLLGGITTVVHHGRHANTLLFSDYPVYLKYQYLHAVDTEPFWKLKLMIPGSNPVMIHMGEGVDEAAEKGISKFLRWNVFNRQLIGVHAIAMNQEQSKNVKAIVWCPESNFRLYKKTADVTMLKKSTTILFGTDSALSASANIWDHLRLARGMRLLSDHEIFETLVQNPINIFKGMKQSGRVIARKKVDGVWNSFFQLNPEDILMVMIDDRVMVMDQSINNEKMEGYQLIRVGNSMKWLPEYWAKVIQELVALGVRFPLQVNSVN